MVSKREDVIRGSFSFFAAATLLYMSAEYAEYFIVQRERAALPISIICLCLSVFEARKVGQRAERILGLR
jgi:hypothetical protein